MKFDQTHTKRSFICVRLEDPKFKPLLSTPVASLKFRNIQQISKAQALFKMKHGDVLVPISSPGGSFPNIQKKLCITQVTSLASFGPPIFRGQIISLENQKILLQFWRIKNTFLLRKFVHPKPRAQLSIKKKVA